MDKMDEKPPPPSPVPARWKLLMMQVCLGVVANLGSISAGANLGYSAVALPQMRQPNSTLVVTADEASWIGKNRSGPECVGFTLFLCPN